MNLYEGLIQYLMLVALLTLHEFGHAWTAMKCGDDTARLQGRVSLNPLVHIDPIGTVLLPLMMIFLPGSISRFMIGWAKPVPVNPYNLRNKNLDDILVTMAGPGMNLLLAILLVALARVGQIIHSEGLFDMSVTAAHISLILCFFNLIPVPPLDGSHVLRVITGMSWEAYQKFAQFGFLIVIVLLQIPYVQTGLAFVVRETLILLAWVLGIR